MNRFSPEVKIGQVKIGGRNKIAIQSMTNTETSDIKASALQCIELFSKGAEIVRLTVNNQESAQAIPQIKKEISKKGYNIPLVGDFHFNGYELLKTNPKMALALDKYRINPSNVDNFEGIIALAVKNNKPVRIGLNEGALIFQKDHNEKTKATDIKNPRNILVKTAMDYAMKAEKVGLKRSQIVISVKMSDVMENIKVHEELFDKMRKSKMFYALHLGLTEAGSGLKGVVSSASALAILLNKGIGDTIRVSITQDPDEDRTKEVEVCKHILQSLGIRSFYPKITSCPGCGRTDFKYFQELAYKIKKYVEGHTKKWSKKYIGIENLKLAIMGCLVNGPGESKFADISINLPGANEKKMATVFVKGKYFKTLQGKNIYKEFIEILEKFISNNYKKA